MKKILLAFSISLICSSGIAQINYSCFDSDLQYHTPKNYKPGSMEGYLTYQEVLDELDLMKQLYPNLISARAPIGNFLTEGTPDNNVTPSIGGNTIQWVRISDNPESNEDEPEILYDTLIHGNEWGSMMQLIFYMWYVLENYESDPMIKAIVDNTELYFVPVLNPDGFLYSELTHIPGIFAKGRKNRNGANTDREGVDINRNFDYFIDGDPQNGIWGTGPNSNTTDPTGYNYAGKGPFSEAESKAMKWFVEQHEFDINLTCHNNLSDYWGKFYYPFSYNLQPTDEDEIYRRICTELGSINNFNHGLVRSETAGLVPDFMYGTVGTHERIFSILIESPSTRGVFIVSPERLIEINKETLSYNLMAARLLLNNAMVNDTQEYFVGSSFNSEVSFKLLRTGLNGNGDFSVGVEAVSDNILYADNTTNVTGLGLLEEFDGLINIKLDPEISDGEEIVYDLVINNGLYTTKKRIYKRFGYSNTIFENRGENLSINFQVSGGEIWDISTEEYVSIPSSIVAQPTTTVESYLTINPSFNLSDVISAQLSYQTKRTFSGIEKVQVQATTDGENWVPLCGVLSKLPQEGDFIGEPTYFKGSDYWLQETIDLQEFIGEVISIRFAFYPESFAESDKFWLDDIKLNIISDNDTGLNSRLEVYPNPADNVLYIDTDYQNYSTEIFDITGKLLRREEQLSGSRYIDLSPYSQGMYFLRVRSDVETRSFKILKK